MVFSREGITLHTRGNRGCAEGESEGAWSHCTGLPVVDRGWQKPTSRLKRTTAGRNFFNKSRCPSESRTQIKCVTTLKLHTSGRQRMDLPRGNLDLGTLL